MHLCLHNDSTDLNLFDKDVADNATADNETTNVMVPIFGILHLTVGNWINPPSIQSDRRSPK